MDIGERTDRSGQGHAERTRDLHELRRLTDRYRQLTWGNSVKDQRERDGLNAPIMKLYCTLFPHAPYAWGDEYEMVMRTARASSRGPKGRPGNRAKRRG